MVDSNSTPPPWGGPHKSNDPETWSHWSLAEEVKTLRAEVERLKACLHDYENTYPEAKDSLRAEAERWKAIAQAHNDSLVERIAEVNHWMDETVKKHNEGMAIRAENERLKDENAGFIAPLQAENERFREALEDIADKYGDVASAEIARAALQPIDLQNKLDKIEKDDPERHRRIVERSAALRVGKSALSAESATYNERWKSKP
jgi:chromosome segregation ATPase